MSHPPDGSPSSHSPSRERFPLNLEAPVTRWTSISSSLSFVAFAAAVAGCAASAKTSPSPIANQTLGPGLLQWTGRFQPVQQQSGDATSIRGRNRASGSVKLTAVTEGRMNANIEVSTPLTQSSNIRWALASGSCGSGALPVLPVNDFPEIDVTSSGRGDLKADVPASLPTAGSYHVNVYWTDGRDESDVMTCANLKLEPRR